MHQLFCSICSEVAYEFDGCGDPHDGAESTCPGCGARGHVVLDYDEGHVTAYWYANKWEWERILYDGEFAQQVMEVGYGEWKELFYAE